MSTGLGIILGFILLISAIIMGGGGKVFLNPEAIMITLGGTLAATLISFPLARVIKFFTLVIRLFQKERSKILEQTVTRLVTISHQANQGSIFSLEKLIKRETDRYIRLGLKLLTQNAAPQYIARRFSIEMEGVKSRHQQGIQLFSFMSKVAPSFGLVGTLIGLINMLRGVGSDVSPDTLGPSMAVALITTLYGALLSFLLFLPASEKLKAYSAEELTTIKMVRDATLMIRDGQSSRDVEEMLNAYLPPRSRQSTVEKLMMRQSRSRAKKVKAKPVRAA